MKLSFNLGTFTQSFPNASVSSKAVEYTIMDSEYRVKSPTFSGNDLVVVLDHIRGGATDDHVTLVLTFDPATARLQAVQANWEAGGTGVQIPAIVVTAVDAAAVIAGALGAPETLGISEVAMGLAVAAFDVSCELFNALSPALLKLSDDGGRLYTLAVACHTLNRACSSMSVK
ncbi:hypothetical protein [Hymenobacter sp. IS2118]|uniref:hypothetical protein n=1 Tax=Hymenobacter sp. IS2118 TaxID=1505605 RepID=UPI00055782CB|nr:hypothetical protein [Hymenobacter sp. IS2118]